MNKGRLTYNLNFKKDLLDDKKDLDALSLYYCMKALFVNSVIYTKDKKQIFQNLKALKVLNRKYTYDKFLNKFNLLINSGYIIEEKRFFKLKKIKHDRGYYKDVIIYDKNNITLNNFKTLFLLAETKYSAHRQRKAMSLREKTTLNTKESFKDVVKTIRLQKKHRIRLQEMGGSFSSKISFTYRNIAKKMGISLSETWVMMQELKKQKLIVVETIKENVGRFEGGDFEDAKIVFQNQYKCYCYLNRKGDIIAVKGSEIISI